MVVDDLDVMGISVLPAEADTPLIIDADAVLSGSVATQRFQPVVRRDAQILEVLGIVQHAQLP
jgi:hypothetical protein